MGSRVRDRKNIKRLFDCYMVIEPLWAQHGNTTMVRSPSDPAEWRSTVHSIFPVTYNDQEVLKSAAQFAFPCPAQNENVELFTFVLTGEDSKWTFGYCRYPPHAKQCSLFLSHLPWQELFYRALNYCAEADLENIEYFLTTLYATPIPEPSTCLSVPIRSRSKQFVFAAPSDYGLPSIPESRYVSEFYSGLGVDSMIKLFVALLAERRIVITSKKLSRLSAIVMACDMFLFPMHWQHIFIPVFPANLQEYLDAPMPFLIGVPNALWDKLPAEKLEEIVRVDADGDTVTTPFEEDVAAMPSEVIQHLKKNLSKDRVQGDGLSRAFLRALVELMGHYEEAFVNDGDKFDEDLFIMSAPFSHRPFLKSRTSILRMQIFHQFIEDRLQRVKDRNATTDEFEREVVAWKSARANGKAAMPALRSMAGSQNKAIKKAGKAVMTSVRRESGHIIESVKQNSALKSAIRSVKESGKQVKHKGHVAYADIRSKLNVPSPMHLPARALSENASPTKQTWRRTAIKRSERQYGSITSLQHTTTNGSITNSLEVPHSSRSSKSSDDNLVHLTSSSSASRLPDAIGSLDENGIKPRLSKSEENLIDFDTPDASSGGTNGFHFSLENPLYEMAGNDVVFTDLPKTEEQLLNEYGLQDYFDQLSVSDSSKHSPQKNTSGWATFE